MTTFADVVNSGRDLHLYVQKAFDTLNKACLQHPTSPRDAGVNNPAKVNSDPFKVLKVDLEDSEMGYALVRGCGVENKIVFSADDDVFEWMNDVLQEFPQ